MDSITITKKEYRELQKKRMEYDRLQKALAEDFFASPPACSAKEIIRAFRATGRYSQKFLLSLEKGLRRSSYFKA